MNRKALIRCATTTAVCDQSDACMYEGDLPNIYTLPLQPYKITINHDHFKQSHNDAFHTVQQRRLDFFVIGSASQYFPDFLFLCTAFLSIRYPVLKKNVSCGRKEGKKLCKNLFPLTNTSYYFLWYFLCRDTSIILIVSLFLFPLEVDFFAMAGLILASPEWLTVFLFQDVGVVIIFWGVLFFWIGAFTLCHSITQILWQEVFLKSLYTTDFLQ